ncbi:MAG: hypothetical protein Q7T86_02120 [Hyphomicrobiaceae bacterium]|nr:hypothetical protein [Hyphomicrobiaceae bacterium]
MTGIRSAAATAGIICAVFAAAEPSQAQQNTADSAAAAYVSADGFSPVDIREIANTVAGKSQSGSAMTVNEISAMEKALLTLDAREATLSRVRYILTYKVQQAGAGQLAFVDLQRFNLGPAVFADAVSSYGAENVDDPAVFGVGPHVAWRLVSQETADTAALVIAAGRKEIPETEAATATCPVLSCLSLNGLEGQAQWAEQPLPKTIGLAPPYPATFTYKDGKDAIKEPSPAYQALQLALATGYAKSYRGSVLWKTPQPADAQQPVTIFTVVIDRNLGQDIMSDAAIGLHDAGQPAQRWLRIGSATADDKLVQTFSTAQGHLTAPARD